MAQNASGTPNAESQVPGPSKSADSPRPLSTGGEQVLTSELNPGKGQQQRGQAPNPDRGEGDKNPEAQGKGYAGTNPLRGQDAPDNTPEPTEDELHDQQQHEQENKALREGGKASI